MLDTGGTVRRRALRRIDGVRVVRVLALVGYAAVVAEVIVSLGGVPASRDWLVVLVLGGLLAASVTSRARLRRFFVGLAVDWLPLVLSLWLYDLVRGFADGSWLPTHAKPQIDVDRVIGFGSIPTVWLQQHLWHGRVSDSWYDIASWLIYLSFFFAPLAVLAALWWFRPTLFRRFAAMIVGLALLACATFVLFPAEPPWLAAQEGRIPQIDRIISMLNAQAPWVPLDPIWETGTRYANNVAAVPSLHASYTLLIAIFFFRRLRTKWRYLLWLYPLAMAFSLVYTGEHYVVDILLGWLYTLAVYAAVERIAAAWAGRSMSRAAIAAARQPA